MPAILYLSQPVRDCLFAARNHVAMAIIHEHNGQREHARDCRSTAQGYLQMALRTAANPTMPFPGECP